MFGKKFLFSILGLFFLSTKLIPVKADCTVSSSESGDLIFSGYGCSSSQVLSPLEDDVSNKYLFYCSTATSCEIKSTGSYYTNTICNTGAAETSCTAEKIGNIYKSDSKFYLCVSTTTESDNVEIKVGATPSTKVITKAKFPGTTGSVVDNTVNINVDGSVTYQGCTSVVNGGTTWAGCSAGAYYLSTTNCSSSSLETSLYLFYCTSSNGCSKEESSITGLSYLNNDTIITCSDSKCTSTEFTSANSGFYVNGGKDKSTKPLIYCDRTTCSTQNASNGYYLSGSDKKDGGNNIYNKVIKCDSNGCSVPGTTPSTEDYYINGDGATINNNGEIIYKKLIKLTSNFSEKIIAQATDAGVYLDAGNGENVIICTFNTTEKGACISKVGNINNGYGYIDANTLGNIIVCPASSCSNLPDVTGDATIITCTKDAQGTTPCTSTSFPSTSSKYAFLDGSTYDSGSSVFKNILVWDSSDKKINQLLENSISTSGIAYIDGSDTEHKRIIKCTSTSCEATANGSNETTNIFFINGVDKNQYVVCTSTEGCVSKPGTVTTSNSDNYYHDSLNSDKVIKCLSKNGNSYTYYLDGFNPGKVLECKNGTICTENEGLSTNGYAYIDAVTSGNVIICKSNDASAIISTKSTKRDGNNSSSTTCSSQSSGAKPADTTAKTVAQNPGFLNAAAEHPTKTIIICSKADTSSSPTCTSSVVTVVQGLAFLDGSSVDANGNFKNVIICDTTKSDCKTLVDDSETSIKKDGYAYIDGGSPSSTKYINIIRCKDSVCKVEGNSTNNGEVYIDSINPKYVISCTDTEYLSQLIYCPNQKNCTTYQSVAKSGHSEYYPKSTISASELLVCNSENSNIKCG
ncbi:hypothetical protein BCR32DRAFT_284194 [Anaeromyces robustus]|uniref:Scaffoldin n=1 Tax=Anaeromyces robustus TaxID=1754192 RepID=A0A1Y1WTF3_9FUNG|nr:hypothetical protein BCR32DRAFT_284194 [Anaeromyces robustus]|eukprot:ORX76424.1 hypothetical protein BCR32DRAFT_284194 [Anaeromyces robustus]